MNSRRVLILCLLLSCAVFSGCTYSKNRANDFLDSMRLSVGVGFGVGVQAKATGFFHPSFGLGGAAQKFGWDTRGPEVGTWHEVEGFFPVGTLIMPMQPLPNSEHSEGLTLPWMYQRSSAGSTKVGSYLFFSTPPSDERLKEGSTAWRWIALIFDFEAGFSAPIINARVGANPPELIDFLLGWTTLDIAGDDATVEGTDPPQKGITSNGDGA
jgi:hypothetical protein